MECPVCLEIFETPLLLPGCGHTICQKCAELLVTPDNYLRCPECRLVYQLRRGVASLPKNIALQRTIDEHHRSSSKDNLLAVGTTVSKCAEHPGDAVSLYCRTCEKSICLKCYFSSNTLRKGQTTHAGHKVETSEDVLAKEKRLLEENYNSCLERRVAEAEYIEQLKATDAKMKQALEKKLEEIEKNKNDLISQVKKTAAKLKFTLKGTAARDNEFLTMALKSAEQRLEALDKLVELTEELKDRSKDISDLHAIRDQRVSLEVLPGLSLDERVDPMSFTSIEHFNTDLQACLNDPKKALAYQMEVPRDTEIEEKECIISDSSAYIVVRYNETVRVEYLTVYYKEALYKGLSEKQWAKATITRFSKGKGDVVVQDLTKATMYRMYVKAINDFGESAPSKEVRFKTAADNADIRTT